MQVSDVNWALQATLASPPELPPLLLPELLPELLPLLLAEVLPLLLPELLPEPPPLLLELPVGVDELHADIEPSIVAGRKIAAHTAKFLTLLFMMAHSLYGARTRSVDIARSVVFRDPPELIRKTRAATRTAEMASTLAQREVSAGFHDALGAARVTRPTPRSRLSQLFPP